jgi:hypothetical protein
MLKRGEAAGESGHCRPGVWQILHERRRGPYPVVAIVDLSWRKRQPVLATTRRARHLPFP